MDNVKGTVKIKPEKVVLSFMDLNPPKTGGFPQNEPVTREMTREWLKFFLIWIGGHQIL